MQADVVNPLLSLLRAASFETQGVASAPRVEILADRDAITAPLACQLNVARSKAEAVRLQKIFAKEKGINEDTVTTIDGIFSTCAEQTTQAPLELHFPEPDVWYPEVGVESSGNVQIVLPPMSLLINGQLKRSQN